MLIYQLFHYIYHHYELLPTSTQYYVDYLTDLISAEDLDPGTHTITVWVNGGSVQPLGSATDFNETYYENNYFGIGPNILQKHIPISDEYFLVDLGS